MALNTVMGGDTVTPKVTYCNVRSVEKLNNFMVNVSFKRVMIMC